MLKLNWARSHQMLKLNLAFKFKQLHIHIHSIMLLLSISTNQCFELYNYYGYTMHLNLKPDTFCIKTLSYHKFFS